MLKLVTALIIIFIIVTIIIYSIAQYYLKQVISREVKNPEILFQSQCEKGFIDRNYYESLKKEEVEIKTHDGLKLKGIYIEGDKNSKNTIIFVHGITVGIPTSIKYMEMFHKRGWNVLMYDQRRHGKSEGKYSTYGFYEKYDLDLWVNWIIKKNGKNQFLGLHGESMGAATVLQYLEINQYVKFIIEDCGYSDMNELLEYRMKNDMKYSFNPILKFAAIIAKRRAKFNFADVSPINVIRKNSLPILFIHGKEDDFVPTYMVEDMYNASKGIKKLYLAEGAGHACSITVNKELYEKVVFEFIENVASKK